MAFVIFNGGVINYGNGRFQATIDSGKVKVLEVKKADNTRTSTDTTIKAKTPVKSANPSEISSPAKQVAKITILKDHYSTKDKNKILTGEKLQSKKPVKAYRRNIEEVSFQDDKLSTKELLKVERIIYDYYGSDKHRRISVAYYSDDINSVSCSRQLYDYLISRGYSRVHLGSTPSNENNGFLIFYTPDSTDNYETIVIYIGKMGKDERVFNIH